MNFRDVQNWTQLSSAWWRCARILPSAPSLQHYNVSECMQSLIVFTKLPYACSSDACGALTLWCNCICTHCWDQLRLLSLSILSMHPGRWIDMKMQISVHMGHVVLWSQPCKTLTPCQPQVMLSNWGTASQLLIITLFVHHPDTDMIQINWTLLKNNSDNGLNKNLKHLLITWCVSHESKLKTLWVCCWSG